MGTEDATKELQAWKGPHGGGPWVALYVGGGYRAFITSPSSARARMSSTIRLAATIPS